MRSSRLLLVTLALAACEPSRSPVAPFLPDTVGSVSAGGFHTCALTSGGKAYCWGANFYGQLGVGGGDTAMHTTAVPVAGNLTFATISAGLWHTCGVTTSGSAYCWGVNLQGQLGIGTADSNAHSTPQAVSGGLTFVAVGAGADHTCGLTTGGAAYCWGYNGSGELGLGVQDQQTHAPAPVAGALAFASIAVGGSHSCGLTAAGAAYCWGDNGYGEIGDGTVLNSRPSPTAVAGNLAFAAIGAAGDYLEGDLNGGHTCALTRGGAAYCWGLYVGGQRQTAPSVVTGGFSFARVSTFDDVSGGYHACALTPAGAAYCWGSNYGGALGDGTRTYRSDPTAVAGGLTFVAVSAGGDHTCGVTTGGKWYCWGAGYRGQLGNGSTDQADSLPVRVLGQP